MGDGMNEYPWHYVLKVNPRATKDDIEEIREIGDWDLLIIFKNGEKIIYDTHWDYHRRLFYKDINELTEEQERREFGRKLRKILSRKGYTQELMEELTGVSQTMFSRYMTGACMPSASRLRMIAKILGCSMDDFFYDDYSDILKGYENE